MNLELNNINKPFVSVIIPTYNRSWIVKRAIESVLGQTYNNFECIAIDDASTDDTQEVLKKYAAQDNRIQVILHSINRHACATRNSGIKKAKGDFIAFLDDDDEWISTKLEKQMSLMMSSKPKIGLIYCWMDYYDLNGKLIREHHPKLRGDIFREEMTNNKIGGTPTLLLRKDLINMVGLWDESLKIEEDDEWIARLCRYTHVDYVPEVLVRVNTGHGNQISIKIGNEKKRCRKSIASLEKRLSLAINAGSGFNRQRAILYARLANLYFRVGEKRKAIQYFWTAFSSSPLEWETAHMLLSLAKRYIVGDR